MRCKIAEETFEEIKAARQQGINGQPTG